jgi:MoxR-like ATPase
VFFFDELNTATPSVQAAFYRIILEGKLDNIDISKYPRLGAGNRSADLAAVQRMPTPLVSRFLHMTLEPSKERLLYWRCVPYCGDWNASDEGCQ